MQYHAPVEFAKWMTDNKHLDKKMGREYRYHSRSDSHSKALCRLIVRDLVAACPVMAQHAREGKIAYSINLKYEFPTSKKQKTLDLAIGCCAQSLLELAPDEPMAADDITRVLLSCEAKTCMTEHGKSQPRIFDELSSSHAIVHEGDSNAIAAGITVVNIADKFMSPLRQAVGQDPHWSIHKQPHAAERMISHLRGLPIRQDMNHQGFDGYATVVISCDNQEPASLWTAAPAPQPGERDYYDTLIENLARAYEQRFSDL